MPVQDRHIRRGQDEYAHALSALLPQGIAWPRWPTSVIMQVVHGLAGIFGYDDNRAADLLERESDPRLTVEMLDSWERAWGLPLACLINVPQTVADRQKMLVLWMTWMGGQSRDYFISVANWIGYEATITEYRPFMVGVHRCGDNRQYNADGSLGDWPAWIGPPAQNRFAWTMHVKRPKLSWFRCGSGQCGIDPHLRIGIYTDLECLIRTWRPAHTTVLFDYSGVTPPDHMAGTP